MNAAVHLSPRIAMFQGAVSLLPHFTSRPLSELSKDEQRNVFTQAVFAARQLMKLCDYGESELTVADLRATVAAATEPKSPTTKPEWIRLPNKGRCPYTGLSRSMIYTLVSPCDENGHKPPVRSVSLRRRGNARGVRLIDLQSLLQYLESKTEETHP